MARGALAPVAWGRLWVVPAKGMDTGLRALCLRRACGFVARLPLVRRLSGTRPAPCMALACRLSGSRPAQALVRTLLRALFREGPAMRPGGMAGRAWQSKHDRPEGGPLPGEEQDRSRRPTRARHSALSAWHPPGGDVEARRNSARSIPCGTTCRGPFDTLAALDVEQRGPQGPYPLQQGEHDA